jgi:tetratricopeptide (TPR) repeat protein
LIAAAGVPIGLFARNVKQVRWERGPEYSQFGKLAAASLPTEGAIVLGDDSVRLFAVHSALVTKGHEEKYVLVDTSALQDPAYHAHLARNHSNIWPSAYGQLPRREAIPQIQLIQLVYQLSQSHPIFYLHPSFGYYFESFYSVPKQVVYQLFPYTTNMSFAPQLKPEEAKELDQYWQHLRGTEIKHLPDVVKVARRDKQQSGTSFYMSAIYAKSMNDLGVRFQRAGELEKARDFFEYALQLNPDNVSALINSEYNAQLRAGNRESGPPSEAVKKRLSTYNGSWEGVMQYNGPVDEPNSCYLVAQAFARGNNFRQSARELDRVCELTPNNIPAQLALAVVYAESGQSEDAMRKVAEIRSKFSNLNVTDHLTLAECEAWARLFQNDLAGAEKALTSAQEQYPDRPEPYKALAEIYLNRRDAAKAGAILEKLVKSQPENVDGLINYAALQMRQERYAEAIPYLDRALLLQPDNFYARLNRGIANFKTGKLDAAWEDYQTLERSLPKPTYIVHFALGEIALQKKQKRTALEHYQKYLELAPPGTQEVKDVEAKIKALKNGTA